MSQGGANRFDDGGEMRIMITIEVAICLICPKILEILNKSRFMKIPRAQGLAAHSTVTALTLLISSNLAFSADNTPVYAEIIAPMMEAKCASCHGTEKQKGKLRVDTYELLKKGGSEGPGIVPGNLDESGITFRVDLPLDDDEHMPPEDKTQLTDIEVKILNAWVQKGGTQKLTLAELGLADDLKASANQLLASLKSKPAKKGPTAAEKKAAEERAKIAKAAMTKINASGATLMPIAQNTPELRFSALNVVDKFGDKELQALKPVADQIAWADLARTKVTDGGLAILSGMTNLTKLHLEQTTIGDSGLTHLAKLSKLEYLNLYKTNVTDAGIQKLAGLKNLKRLYLWQSKATPAGVDRLRAAVPGLRINLGWEYEAKTKAVQAAAVAKPETPKPVAKKPAPAPKPAVKPAPKPAPAPQPLAKVESNLSSALAETNRLLAAANMEVTTAGKAVTTSNAALANAKKKYRR